MIKTFTATLLLLLSFTVGAQNINIPDANFKKALVDNALINTNGDEEISESEAVAFTGTINVSNLGITDLTGIEFFTYISKLHCPNNKLTSIDLSKNINITILGCYNNQLTSLNLDENTAITFLNCSDNQLENLNLTNNIAIKQLSCDNNKLTDLDLTNNTAITNLSFDDNLLTDIDLNKNTAITNLYCSYNKLTNLNLNNNIAISVLSCSHNKLSSLSLTNNPAIIELYCSNNQLIGMDLTNNPAIKKFSCTNNNLTSLNLTNNPALTSLSCYFNKLTSINLENNIAITTISCFNNNLTSLDLRKNTSLTNLYCDNNNFLFSELIKMKDSYPDLSYTSKNKISPPIDETDGFIMDYSTEAQINGIETVFTWYDINNKVVDESFISKIGDGVYKFLKAGFFHCKMTNETFPTLVLETDLISINGHNFINIPDANFKKALVDNTKININDDDEISEAEAVSFTGILNVSYLDIIDLTGIECFTEIIDLSCADNDLTTLNISKNTKLETLFCSSNELVTLDVSNNTQLTSLTCGYTAITSLDLRNNVNLTDLSCYQNNNLTDLDVSNNTLLTSIRCSGSSLVKLNVSNNPKLKTLECYRNNLSELDISNNPLLTDLECFTNKFPFSQLYKIKKHYGDFDYESYKSIFTQIFELYGYTIDYSAEAYINGNETTFTWHDSKGNVIGDEFIKKVSPGVYQFLISGFFECKMINETFPGLELTTNQIIIRKHEQNITIEEYPEKIKVGNTLEINARASSNLNVSFKRISGDVTIVGNKIIPNEEGVIEIKAIQTGNNEFNSTEKVISFTAEKKDQSITIEEYSEKIKVGNTIEINATASSNLKVSYKLVSGDATVIENKITPNKEGVIEIKAIQTGNNEFNSTEKVISFTAEKKEQNIFFHSLNNIAKVKDIIEINVASSSGLSVSLSIVSGDAKLDGNTLTVNNAGKVIIKASQSGNFEFLETETTKEIVVEKRSQTFNFIDIPASAKVSDILTLNVTASSNLPVSFEIISGEVTLKEKQLTCTKSGTVKIKAIQTGNYEFEALKTTFEIVVSKKTQTISFTSPPSSAKVNDVLSLKANAGSTLPVSFEIVSGEASLNGNQLTCTKSGILKVKAKQVGNDEYEASEATVEIAVNKKDQFITFNDVPSEVEATDQLDMNVTNSSGLEVSYIIVKGNANIIGNTITFNEVGNVIIKAINSGNDEYNETEQSYLFIVRKKEQEINADNIPSQVTINENLDLNLYASSGLAIDLEIIYGTALLSGTNLNFTEAGEVKVKASQAGNSIYESTETSFTISVIKKDQTLDIQNTSGSVIINETMELIATASSTLPVSFSIILGDAELYGNSITFTSAGDVTIKAKQIGNNEFIAVEQIIEFTVNKKTQTVNFVNAPETGKVNDVIALNTVASSGLEVTFEIVEGEAILNGNQLTYTNSGVVKVKATQAGNDVYESAEATIEITIGKKYQTVSFVDAPTNAKVKDVIELNATSSSSLDVSFEIVEGEAILNSNQLTCTNSGVVKVKATQVGNDEFEAAEVIIEITVGKRDQSIDFANAPTTVKAKDEIELNASATSGLEVTFELVSGNANINGNLVTFNEVGTIEIKAIQAGNDEYEPCEKTIKITVDFATGIEVILESSTQIYPNPVVSEMAIKFAKSEERIIRIFDLQGRLKLERETTSSSERLNLSNFKSGMYLMKIQSARGSFTYKIVKK